AFSRLLRPAPHLLPLALRHWSTTASPFDWLSVEGVSASETAQLQRVHAIAQAACGLLELFPTEVLPLWNWSAFFQLMAHTDMLLRWRAASIVALAIKLDEQSRRRLFIRIGALGEAAGGDGERSDSQLSSRATGKVCAEAPHPSVMAAQQAEEAAHASAAAAFSAPKRPHSATSGPGTAVATATPFIRTPSAQHNIEALSIALTQPRPILLYGPAGAGKSALLREVARLIGGSSDSDGDCRTSGSGGDGDTASSSSALLELHLDDQTDSKALLGAYVCSDIPGEFVWRPGVLAQAATAGRWVVIEDIDRAPLEVLATLVPLLEGGELEVPPRPPLRVAPGFRLFGTVSTATLGKGGQDGGSGITLGGAADFGTLWTRVEVLPPSAPELLSAAAVMHRQLPQPLLTRMLDMLLLLCGDGGSSSIG
ncbi:unnamed protein product, partial [Phaeothamnion confervicola]